MGSTSEHERVRECAIQLMPRDLVAAKASGSGQKYNFILFVACLLVLVTAS